MGSKNKKEKKDEAGERDKQRPPGAGEKKRETRRKAKKRRRRLIAFLALVLAVIGLLILHARLPRIAKGALEKALPVLADVGKASFSWPGTITIEDVTLRRTSDKSQLCSIKRIVARCRLRGLLAARVGLDSLEIENVLLSLRRGDDSLLRGTGRVPDHTIQVKGLSAQISREEGEGPGPWLDVSGVAAVLQPQASGCMSIEGSGSNSAMGRFRLTGILGGKVLESRVAATFPRVPIGPDVRGILPKEAADLVAKLEPAGEAELTAELFVPRERKKAGAGLDVRWRLSLNGVSLKLPQLSDRITGIKATVEGTAKDFVVTDATGSYQSALLSCRAHSLPADGSVGLMVRAQGRDLRPAPDIFKLLPPKVRKEVERLHIGGGRFDLDLELRLPSLGKQADGSPPKADFVRADLSLRDCSATPEWFPYKLEKITGKLSIGLDELVVTGPLVGWHGAGRIRMTGTIGVSEERAYSEIVVEAKNLDVGAGLDKAIGALGPQTLKTWRSYSLKGGTVDAELNIRGSLAKGAERDWAVRLSFDGCSGAFGGFPYALTGLTGQVDIGPTRVFVKNLTGWHGDATVRISGWADARRDRNEMNIHVCGTNVLLDDGLAAALRPENRKTWDRFRPSGVADIDVVLSTPTRKDAGVDVRLSVLLKGCSARAPAGEKWVPLADITGRLEAFGDVVRLTGFKAKCLDGRAVIDMTAIEADGLTKLQGELAGVGLSAEKLIGLLPADAARKTSFLAPSGKVGIGKLSFDVIQRPGEKPDVQYQCAGELRDARIAIPMADVAGEPDDAQDGRLALSEISGRFDIENERGRAATGTFRLDQVRLLHGTMRNVAGRIKKTGPVFALEDVRGEMYGGRVEASFKGAADLLFFTGHARVIGMDVARLCRETGLTNERVWGDLEGTVQLGGERVVREGKKPVWRLDGSGSFQIDRANLGRTPLVRSIFSYKSFLLGAESVVEGAKLDFEIDSRQLKIHKMELSGPAVRTRGVGTVDYGKDPKLDLYFYRKRKGSLLPNLPVVELVGKGLGWVVEKVQNQIVVVRVTGTLKDPKVSGVVLKDAGEQVGRLIIFNLWEQQKAETTKGEDEAGD
ncbi:MAG: hypothetical protein ABIF82_14870 [Planctomycetota bacterium]